MPKMRIRDRLADHWLQCDRCLRSDLCVDPCPRCSPADDAQGYRTLYCPTCLVEHQMDEHQPRREGAT